jgi:hypothetical protein
MTPEKAIRAKAIALSKLALRATTPPVMVIRARYGTLRRAPDCSAHVSHHAGDPIQPDAGGSARSQKIQFVIDRIS